MLKVCCSEFHALVFRSETGVVEALTQALHTLLRDEWCNMDAMNIWMHRSQFSVIGMLHLAISAFTSLAQGPSVGDVNSTESILAIIELVPPGYEPAPSVKYETTFSAYLQRKIMKCIDEAKPRSSVAASVDDPVSISCSGE